MNAYQLYHQDGREAGVWVCSTCNVIFSARHGGKDEAESCCVCRHCGRPAPRDDKDCYTRMHHDCWQEQNAERQAKRLAEAEEFAEYDGWVFLDGVGPQDGYFASAEEAEEYIWDTLEDGEELPQWAFCCEREEPRFPDAEDIVERVTDNLYEGAADDIEGIEALERALERFAEVNKDLHSWTPDYSRKVRLSFEDQQRYERRMEQ